MRVVVTGAAGRLGRRVCEELRMRGHEVQGIDVTAGDGVVAGDLLDPKAADLFQGAEAVVHAAGNLGCHGESGELVYVQNVTMAHHVFAGAAAARAKKVIFASSIQVIGWGGDLTKSVWGFVPEYLPLDDDCPRQPQSLYALGKAAIEDLLKFEAENQRLEGVSLRLPRLMEGGSYREWRDKMQREGLHWIGMSYRQAGRLIADCLERPLPGYRSYLAADADVGEEGHQKEFIRRHFPEAVLRKTLADGLLDCSRVMKETGWRPGDWAEES